MEIERGQASIFDGQERFRIDKPIRLIELFAGYGSQALALKYLGVKFEHYKICEWAINSIQAYKDMHFAEDNTDYSAELNREEVFESLFDLGISSDYSSPMTFDKIKRMGEKKARKVYNNIKATHNLVSVCNVKGRDLEITETDKYAYILTWSFPCQDLSAAGGAKRHCARVRHKKQFGVGSHTHTERMQTKTASVGYGERAANNRIRKPRSIRENGCRTIEFGVHV